MGENIFKFNFYYILAREHNDNFGILLMDGPLDLNCFHRRKFKYPGVVTKVTPILATETNKD
ncbi:MAG: hypothetical protein CMM75_00605 [Rhodospirillaceae bacterium]|nr:hypothetical protein [Rhodospirillaceae bacterium]